MFMVLVLQSKHILLNFVKSIIILVLWYWQEQFMALVSSSIKLYHYRYYVLRRNSALCEKSTVHLCMGYMYVKKTFHPKEMMDLKIALSLQCCQFLHVHVNTNTCLSYPVLLPTFYIFLHSSQSQLIQCTRVLYTL